MSDDRCPGTRDVTFLPGRQVRVPAASTVAIKGQLAGSTSGTHFAEVYDRTPVVSAEECRRVINEWVTESPGTGPDLLSDLSWMSRLRRPFRIADARDEKIVHSLEWIHTNLSRNAESGKTAPDRLFRAFALLLKADDYRLTKVITPNSSMALQNAVTAALVPGHLRRVQERATTTNRNALRSLRELHLDTDLLRLCAYAVFSGTTWFAQVQHSALETQSLGGLGHALRHEECWAVDQRAEFLTDALGARSLLMILDDCGEAVFDLHLALGLLARNPDLEITVLARAVDDGVNVTSDSAAQLLHRLLHDRADMPSGSDQRVRFVPVHQPFPSFEPAFFPPPVREALQRADVVLVKGAGFFETTVLDRETYYSFVVHGLSTRILTGMPRGHGVLWRIGDPLTVSRDAGDRAARPPISWPDLRLPTTGMPSETQQVSTVPLTTSG